MHTMYRNMVIGIKSCLVSNHVSVNIVPSFSIGVIQDNESLTNLNN